MEVDWIEGGCWLIGDMGVGVGRWMGRRRRDRNTQGWEYRARDRWTDGQRGMIGEWVAICDLVACRDEVRVRRCE